MFFSLRRRSVFSALYLTCILVSLSRRSVSVMVERSEPSSGAEASMPTKETLRSWLRTLPSDRLRIDRVPCDSSSKGILALLLSIGKRKESQQRERTTHTHTEFELLGLGNDTAAAPMFQTPASDKIGKVGDIGDHGCVSNSCFPVPKKAKQSF